MPYPSVVYPFLAIWSAVIALALVGGLVRTLQFNARFRYYVESGLSPEQAAYWAARDFGLE